MTRDLSFTPPQLVPTGNTAAKLVVTSWILEDRTSRQTFTKPTMHGQAAQLKSLSGFASRRYLTYRVKQGPRSRRRQMFRANVGWIGGSRDLSIHHVSCCLGLLNPEMSNPDMT